MSLARVPTLSLVGASHRSASVELRERLAFPEDQIPGVLAALRREAAEAMVLSTCNRTEIYLVGDRTADETLLGGLRGIEPGLLIGRCYRLQDEDAVRHLFRVASSLDSMVLGETQILGQVRDAFEVAARAGTIGRVLGRVLPLAVEVGKRARSETRISRRALSPSSVAVELARRQLGPLHALTALVVGAGDAARATARSLRAAGLARILVANRSPERGADLAAAVQGEVLAYSQLGEGLRQADLVITSTGAADHVLTRRLVEQAMTGRADRPLLAIDIAMPRDIDPTVAEIPGVILRNIDDLEEVCVANLRQRAGEIEAVEAIVEEGVADYLEWRAVEPLAPTIGALYQRAEAIRRAELERTLPRLHRLTESDRELIDVMTAAIVRRLLHPPVAALKARTGRQDGADLAALVQELFALPGDSGGD